jgi:hypothetical protein
MIDLVGAQTTSSRQLQDAADKIYPPGFFRGVFPATMEPPDDGSTHYMILNTSNAPPGKHWVGLFRNNGEQVLFDSFGRAQGEGDLSLLSQYDVTEEDAEQPISTHPDLQYCGAACLAFGLVALKFGMRGARKI